MAEEHRNILIVYLKTASRLVCWLAGSKVVTFPITCRLESRRHSADRTGSVTQWGAAVWVSVSVCLPVCVSVCEADARPSVVLPHVRLPSNQVTWRPVFIAPLVAGVAAFQSEQPIRSHYATRDSSRMFSRRSPCAPFECCPLSDTGAHWLL